jgi:hypothetical protein
MKRSEREALDPEQIVMALVKMRIERFATTKTMLDFLMKDLGFGMTRSYQLVNEAKEKISEIFKEETEQSFNNAVGRLEEMIESTKNEKMRLEAQKELNKLLGLHKPQKLDLTSAGEQLPTEIVVKIISDGQTYD